MSELAVLDGTDGPEVPEEHVRPVSLGEDLSMNEGYPAPVVYFPFLL